MTPAGSGSGAAVNPCVRHLWGVRITMRDGSKLVADIHLPPAGAESEPPTIKPDRYPSVVIRTPYSKQNPLYTDPAWYLARHGYAVLVQDVRGRGDSDGEFYPFFNNEGPDGYDTIEWAAAQPWSNGRVGMMGGSYAGWVQWCAAALRPPHLVTMVSASAATHWFQQVPYHNGVPTLPQLPWLWSLRGRVPQDRTLVDNWTQAFLHLPLIDADRVLGAEMPVWREWFQHSRLDEWWQSRRLHPADFEAVTQPVLHITSTYDGTQPGALNAWRGALAHSPAAGRQRMVFGPWDHLGAASSLQKSTLGGLDFGPDAVLDVNELHRRWFDRWLREPAEVTERAPEEPDAVARVFYTGVNRWQDEAAWPPAERGVPWYLRSRGVANTAAGNGELSADPPEDEPPDTFRYDPLDPVIDVLDLEVYARPDPLNPVEPPLVRDFVESRSDVLIYTSRPLTRDLVVAGEPRLVLFGGSDAPDTDWHAWLTDVAPDGTSTTLVRGQLCARFRDSLAEEHLMEPDTIYRFEFELLSLAHVFLAGHRVRLVVASSDFPTYARNQNTGHPPAMDGEVRVAVNVVAHDGDHPSHVLLPVVPL
jgi:putative CocE/NonD family hydrolase